MSSSGGVLLDLLALEPHFQGLAIEWAAVAAPDTKSALEGRTVTWIEDFHARQPWKLVPAFFRAWRLLRRGRFSMILSAGTGPAIPFFAAARLRQTPAFWIATLNILTKEGLAANVCKRMATRNFVQDRFLLRADQGTLLPELY